MLSPIKYYAVYDFETGGLKKDFSSITEAAIVIVSNETLEIVEEFSVVLLPRLDLRTLIDSTGKKEIKRIFSELAVKDDEDGIKKLNYKGQILSPRTMLSVSDDFDKFLEYLKERNENKLPAYVLEYEDYLEILETEYKDVMEMYFNLCYNPTALAVTHMNKELLLNEGVSYAEGFRRFHEVIEKYTVGQNKPVLAGHNIIDFDNPFLEKWYQDNGVDLYTKVNKKVEDTMTLCRQRWYELSDFKLGTCANALGITLKEAHRALPDTIVNAKVLISIYKNMRGEGQGEVEYVRRKYKLNF